MKGKKERVLALVTLCAALAGGWAHAASFTYATHRKEIKAGVLIFRNPDYDPKTLGSSRYLRAPDPYVFYVMDQRLDLKPSGWDFVNPLAPSRVTKDINSRWGNAYTLDQPDQPDQAVTKDMGCYWEVKLDAGLTELARLDVLFVGGVGNMNFGRSGREKLRKLADAGGVIWIESCCDWIEGRCEGGSFGTSLFFIPGIEFRGGPGGPVTVPLPMRSHPLVNRPFQLLTDELNRLGIGDEAGSRALGGADDRYFASVVLAGSSPVVAAAQYGSGHVVAVAETVGDAISDIASTGPYCPADRVALAHLEDLKFGFNIVSLGTEHTTFHKDSRHAGCSFEEIGAPLVVKWEYPAQSSGTTSSSPAILDDMIFFVDGGGVLHAFDLSLSRDRDRDGNPDDGIPDLSRGARWDELWSASVGAASSPTAAYVPMGGGAAVAAVFVTTQGGKVLAFEASNGAQSDLLTVNGFDADDPLMGVVNIPAPTYADGVVYVGDSKGHLHGYDFMRGQSWRWPSDPRAIHGQASDSPTVGFFHNPMTGSVDQIVYMAARGIPSVTNGGVFCLPMKVFNEVLTPLNETGGLYKVRQQMPIRAEEGTYQVYFADDMGDLQPCGAQVLPGGRFQLSAPMPGRTIVADYEIDASDQRYRYRRKIAIKTRRNVQAVEGYGVTSTPAASPNDILYYATDNGSLYAVQEDGTSVTTKWRWYLNDPGVQSALGIARGARPVGSPAVGNDMVYFAVNDGDLGYILALEADPAFQVDIGAPIDARRPVEVCQFDAMNPAADPMRVRGTRAGRAGGQRVAYTVDYDRGRITVENFLDPLSASQDLIVRFYIPKEAGGSDTRQQIIYPAFGPSEAGPLPSYSWNNLSWYFAVVDPDDGKTASITSSPMLMGNILYFGCSDGRLYALNVERIKQTTGKGAKVVPNPDIASIQPVTPGGGTPEPILATVGGAHGMLAAVTSDGLSVLYNGLTLVADGHRLVEIDAAGNVVWSCDSTTSMETTTTASSGSPGSTVFGAVKAPFNRPAVARRVDTGSMIVADTGNNRVVHIDRAGAVLWQVSGFADPNGLLPPGSPLKLNGPTDVSMWPVVDFNGGYTDYHYLIADSGNYGIVEVVAKFDPSTGLRRNELVWSTQTLQQGKRYRYTSARKFRQADPANPGQLKTLVIAVVSNRTPESGKLETSGGAIVILNEQTGLIEDVISVLEGPDRAYTLVNPVFFNREFTSADKYSDVIADSNGIYVVEHVGTAVADVRFYSADQHRIITGRPLMVSYAQTLPNGNVLVTNKAASPAAGMSGEIFELKYVKDNGSYSWSICWPTEDVEMGRGSYPFEQPSSAERLYQ